MNTQVTADILEFRPAFEQARGQKLARLLKENGLTDMDIDVMSQAANRAYSGQLSDADVSPTDYTGLQNLHISGELNEVDSTEFLQLNFGPEGRPMLSSITPRWDDRDVVTQIPPGYTILKPTEKEDPAVFINSVMTEFLKREGSQAVNEYGLFAMLCFHYYLEHSSVHLLEFGLNSVAKSSRVMLLDMVHGRHLSFQCHLDQWCTET